MFFRLFQVICSLYDSKFTKLKEEFESDANLDLSPHSPDFSLKFEFRDFSYPQTTTIFIKVILYYYLYLKSIGDCIIIYIIGLYSGDYIIIHIIGLYSGDYIIIYIIGLYN